MNPFHQWGIIIVLTLSTFSTSVRAEDSGLLDEPENASPSESDLPSATKPVKTSQPKPETKQITLSPGQTVSGFRLDALNKRGITWDLTPGIGLRLWRSDKSKTKLFSGRLRLGVLLYHEPNFLMLGPSVLVGGVADSIAFGGEVEAVNSQRGVWLQGGLYGDSDGLIGSASVGFTLFGVEFQRRLSGDSEGLSAVFLTLHIPISIIRVALQPPPV